MPTSANDEHRRRIEKMTDDEIKQLAARYGIPSGLMLARAGRSSPLHMKANMMLVGLPSPATLLAMADSDEVVEQAGKKHRNATIPWKFHEAGDRLQVTLCGPIFEGCAPVVCHELKRKKWKTVHLDINSQGGIESDTREILGTLRGLQARVETHARGKCESAAVLLLSAGEHRTCEPDTSFMIHCGSLETPAGDRANNKYAQDLAAVMHTPADSIRSLMDAETRFDARAASNEGLVHVIHDSVAAAEKARSAVEYMDAGQERVRQREERRREERTRDERRQFGTRRSQFALPRDYVLCGDGIWRLPYGYAQPSVKQPVEANAADNTVTFDSVARYEALSDSDKAHFDAALNGRL